MDTEPTDGELRAFIDSMLSNLDKAFREPEVIDEAIHDCRDMWVLLYRANLDADALDPSSQTGFSQSLSPHPGRGFVPVAAGIPSAMAEAYAEVFEPTSAERIARNDATFREANEDIAKVAADSGFDGRVPFICECAEPTCTQIVRLTVDEYRDVRSDPRTFLNAPGHHVAARGWAEVVSENEGYSVVRKIGRAGDVAAELADQDVGPPTRLAEESTQQSVHFELGGRGRRRTD